MKGYTLLLAALLCGSLTSCTPLQMRQVRDASEVVVDTAETACGVVDLGSVAVTAATDAYELCIECARALQEVNEADPMTLHPCLYECLDAVRDAVEAAQDVAGAVESVE
jgi:hypothetical protein